MKLMWGGNVDCVDVRARAQLVECLERLPLELLAETLTRLRAEVCRGGHLDVGQAADLRQHDGRGLAEAAESQAQPSSHIPFPSPRCGRGSCRPCRHAAPAEAPPSRRPA